MVETNVNEGMREMDVRGWIRFSVKAEDTKENQAVHDGFKDYCALETGNNYTLGLKRLLETASSDWKFEVLWQKVQELEQEILRYKTSVVEKQKEDDDEGVF